MPEPGGALLSSRKMPPSSPETSSSQPSLQVSPANFQPLTSWIKCTAGEGAPNPWLSPLQAKNGSTQFDPGTCLAILLFALIHVAGSFSQYNCYRPFTLRPTSRPKAHLLHQECPSSLLKSQTSPRVSLALDSLHLPQSLLPASSPLPLRPRPFSTPPTRPWSPEARLGCTFYLTCEGELPGTLSFCLWIIF